jgi:cytochrome c553
MSARRLAFLGISIVATASAILTVSSRAQDRADNDNLSALENAVRMITRGRHAFRFNNFGNEDFWGGALRLHEAIKGEANGGVGPGLSPNAALKLGLKVDARMLPQPVVSALRAGLVNLDDPAVTSQLLSLDAVVGVRGFFDNTGALSAVGITCALCHSTVDNSFAPGIGARLDGWPNRDLDVGAIIALSPSVMPFAQLLGVDENGVRTVLRGWGPGKFDASLVLDGKTMTPDGKPSATLIPPAYGLAGVNLHTFSGWGSVTHWNAVVAVLEMQGKGTLYDPRLNDAEKFPIAAANKFGDVRRKPDLVTPTLAALHFYQLSIPAPQPPPDSFNAAAAEQGAALFAEDGKAKCARCHVPPLFTEPGWNMHTAEEIGIEAFQAERGPEDAYRTTPLKGAWSRTGGFYHDGRFATLADVVDHYNQAHVLGLDDSEKGALVEYLKSL